jgi:hypothetical protein
MKLTGIQLPRPNSTLQLQIDAINHFFDYSEALKFEICLKFGDFTSVLLFSPPNSSQTNMQQ